MTETNIELQTCKNCENQFSGHYCSQCGQEMYGENLTFRSLLGELFAHLFHHTKVFFYTIKSLVVNPGKVIDEYLGGKRKRYYNALNFYMLVGTILAFIAIQFGSIDPEANMAAWDKIYSDMGVDTSGQHEGAIVAFTWMQEHYNLMLMFFLPFWSVSTFLVFRKRGYNLGQHVIISFYTFGVYSLATLPLFIWGDPMDPSSNLMWINFGIMFGWFAWVFTSVFKVSWIRGTYSSILVYVVYTLVFIATGIVVTILAIIIAIIIKKLL